MLFRSITLQEANLFLPLLKEHFSKIHVLVAKGQALHEKILNEAPQIDTSGSVEVSEGKAELEEIEYKIREQMIELQQYGAIVKSVFPARVDFLSKRHKQPVYLCWQTGDAQVSHWHPVDEGFTTRRLIKNPDAFGIPVVH